MKKTAVAQKEVGIKKEKKIDKKIKEEVTRRLSQKKYNFKKIAKDCGVSVDVVKNVAEELKVKEPIITPYILELLKENPDMSYRQISELACSSTSNVRRVAISSGIEKKSTKQKIIDILKKDPEISYPEISKQTGYSTQNIGKIAREHGLVRHTSFRTTKSKKILEILQENPNMSYATIGERVGSSASYVATVASKFKISNKRDSYTQRVRDIYATEDGKKMTCIQIAEIAGCKPALVSKVISRIKAKEKQQRELSGKGIKEIGKEEKTIKPKAPKKEKKKKTQ